MNRSKQLQSELVKLDRQLHAARRQPPRQNPVIRGFVAGFCGDCPPDDNRTGANLTSARHDLPSQTLPRKFQFSYAQFARAYQTSRQHIPNLVRYFGMEAVENPDRLFEVMATSGRRSHLRQKLTDPQARRKAAVALRTMGKMDELTVKYDALLATLPPRR